MVEKSASRRFTANIRNPNTRRAYARAAKEFFDWLAARGVRELATIESVHVAAYIADVSGKGGHRGNSVDLTFSSNSEFRGALFKVHNALNVTNAKNETT